MTIITVDFETKKILPRPDYPPKPVGMAVKEDSKKAVYYAWGHPAQNNCDATKAKSILQEIWHRASGGEAALLFHNAKFDIDVAETFMKCPRLPWTCYHDTLFLLYLDDPRAMTYALKPSAERILGLKPEERDAVKDWLIENYRNGEGKKVSLSEKSDNAWGAYISEAPGDLVGKYAIGDVDRTHKLFMKLYKVISQREMVKAYDLERELMIYLLDNERQGVRVDIGRLQKDIAKYDRAMVRVNAFLEKYFGSGINFNSDSQLTKALIDNGVADKKKLHTTKTGKLSANKASLADALPPQWSELLRWRAQVQTCVGTFMRPWSLVASKSKGLIYTSWNQVRHTDHGTNFGTSTGRLSSTPNFQNIPNKFTIDREMIKELSGLTLPPPPVVRSYIIPWDEDHVIIERDYSQQELRILAHFENDVLLEKYNEDPYLDFHTLVTNLINEMLGTDFKRKPVKNIVFGLLYGMGIKKLANAASVDEDVARTIKSAILKLFPNIRLMYNEMRERAMTGSPIRTWIGREYYCEPPRLIDGKMRTFDYKLVNCLIQGSAGDCTKTAMVNNFREIYKSKTTRDNTKFYFSIHDQLTMSVRKKKSHAYMQVLRGAMEDVDFDVPMLSEGKISGTNWGDCKPYDEERGSP